MNATTSLPAIYSPDRKHAIVIRDWSGGALGGGTYVDLYSFGGLIESNIVGGDWKIVEAKGVHWKSNKEVVLDYDGRFGEKPVACQSAAFVRVTCAPVSQ